VESVRVSRSHAEAVRVVAFLQSQTLNKEQFGLTAAPVDLYQILRTLSDKRIPFVLTGAHGISGWTGRPRNTLDIDLLAKGGRNHGRVVKALRELYPQLDVVAFSHLTAFFPPGKKESLIDVMISSRGDLEAAVTRAVWVEEQGIRYRVPPLEFALASKYSAMLNPLRSAGKRGQDAIDFLWMVLHSADEGRTPLDLDLLQALAEMVWPGGGGDEILRLVDQVRRGEIPRPGGTREG
jgi:hypothetical protein